MRIGIIVAMSKELDLLIPQLSNHTEESASGITIHRGTIAHHEVAAMQSGIGKVNAAIGALTLINMFQPQLVINTGVAGGGDHAVSVMDLVVGERVAYHDVWCGPESPWGAVQGLPLYYEAPKGIISRLPARDDVKKGLICSGDQFVDKAETLLSIKDKFPDVLAVDMESGAIAQVCHLRHVPFVSMRIISDSPGANHDNTSQYLDFWTDAPKHSFQIVRQLLETIDEAALNNE